MNDINSRRAPNPIKIYNIGFSSSVDPDAAVVMGVFLVVDGAVVMSGT